MHVHVCADRAKETFFEALEIFGRDYLVFSRVEFEFLEVFSLLQSLHSVLYDILVDPLLLLLSWEYPWLASHLVDIQDYFR